MLATTVALPGRAGAEPNDMSGTMNVALDTQNSLLTITIVSDTPWDLAMNFTIAPKKVLISPVDGTGGYQGMADVNIKEKTHREVYKVIPQSDIDGSGLIVRFNCGHNGLRARFLDDHTARLGPFHVTMSGLTTGGVIPLDLRPIMIDPW